MTNETNASLPKNPGTLENVEPGVRNYIRKSGNFKGAENWRAVGFDNIPYSTPDGTLKAVIGTNFANYAYFVNDTVLNNILIPGQPYTLSVCVRANRSMIRTIQIVTDTASHVAFTKSIALTDSFQTFTATFTVSQIPTVNLYMRIGIAGEDWSTGDWLEIKYFKLEKGNTATDWLPAPEDVEEGIYTSDITLTGSYSKNNLKISGKSMLSLDSAKQQTIKWIGTPDANFSAIEERTAIVADQRDITTTATLLSDVFTLIGNSQLEFLLDYACDVTISPNTTTSGGIIVPIGEPARIPLCKVEVLQSNDNNIISTKDYTDLACTGKQISFPLPAGSYRFRITTTNRIYYAAGITRLPDTMTARATCRAYMNNENTAYQGKITGYNVYHVIGRNGMATIWNEENYFYMSPESTDLLKTRGNAELLSPDGRYGLQVRNNGVKIISGSQECMPAPVLCGGNVGVTGGKGNSIGYLNYTPTTDSSTGITRIQHNYGSNHYVVIATVNGEVSACRDNIITVISKTDNYFEVLGKNCTSGINENTPFYFVMFKAN